MSGTTQLDETAAQLKAGMFLIAWIERQPCIANLKQASVALFYVLGAGRVRSDGLDVEVKTVAARSQDLLTQLEKGATVG